MIILFGSYARGDWVAKACHRAVKSDFVKANVAAKSAGVKWGSAKAKSAVVFRNARAILDVLQRRGIVLSDAQRDRSATCRDETTLARWWDLAWTAGTGDELVSAGRAE